MLIDIKGDKPWAMIRKGNYKLNKWCGYDFHFPLLFNLENDRGEKDNLAGKPGYRNIQADLLKNGKRLLGRIIRTNGDVRLKIIISWVMEQKRKGRLTKGKDDS